MSKFVVDLLGISVGFSIAALIGWISWHDVWIGAMTVCALHFGSLLSWAST